MLFFFNLTAPTEIYTLSLHDALPICAPAPRRAPTTDRSRPRRTTPDRDGRAAAEPLEIHPALLAVRSEEHTSELQSRRDLVCRLLLEKKKMIIIERN